MFIVADSQHAGGRVVSIAARDVWSSGRIAIRSVRARTNSVYVASERDSVMNAIGSNCMMFGSDHTISGSVRTIVVSVMSALGGEHVIGDNIVSIGARVHASGKNVGTALAFVLLVRARVGKPGAAPPSSAPERVPATSGG